MKPVFPPTVLAASGHEATKRGAYDIVGDVHGCHSELVALMRAAGWIVEDAVPGQTGPVRAHHPEGRLLVLVGDLTDRGPQSDLVLRLMMGMLEEGTGLCAMGNHDWKLLRHLKGRKVGVGEGLSSTLKQLAPLGKAFRLAVRDMLSRLPHQIRLPMPKGHPREGDGVMTVVHAAAPRHHLDKESKPSFARAIYGYGEVQEDGSLARRDWATDYKGSRWIVHGHEPYAQPREFNRVIALDTGCVFGNALTMYRADRVEFLQERAHANHAEIAKTLL